MNMMIAYELIQVHGAKSDIKAKPRQVDTKVNIFLNHSHWRAMGWLVAFVELTWCLSRRLGFRIPINEWNLMWISCWFDARFEMFWARVPLCWQGFAHWNGKGWQSSCLVSEHVVNLWHENMSKLTETGAVNWCRQGHNAVLLQWCLLPLFETSTKSTWGFWKCQAESAFEHEYVCTRPAGCVWEAPGRVRYGEFRDRISSHGQGTRWKGCCRRTCFPRGSLAIAGSMVEFYTIAHLQHSLGSCNSAIPLCTTCGNLAIKVFFT